MLVSLQAMMVDEDGREGIRFNKLSLSKRLTTALLDRQQQKQLH